MAVSGFFASLHNSHQLNVLDSPGITGAVAGARRVLGMSTATAGDMRAQAFGNLLATQSGRQALADRNANQRRMLASGQTGEGLGVGGMGIPDNPASIAQEYQRLQAERGQIINAQRAASQSGALSGRVATAGLLPTVGNAEASSAASKAAAQAKRDAADAARKAKEQARNRERYEDDLLGLARNEIDLKKDAASDLQQRANLELEGLRLDKEKYDKDVERRRLAGELTDAEAWSLKAANSSNELMKEEIIQRDLRADLAAQDFAARDQALSIKSDLLRGDLNAARTQEDRRRIQLQMLDIEYQRQRQALEAVLTNDKMNEADKALAREKLASLDKMQGNERAGINRDTQGPLAAYLDKLPKSAAELNEAYQQVAADGLSSLNDGLADAIVNSKSLGDVFHNVANQILADLIKIALQKTITGAIGSALGGLFGGSSLTSLLGKGNGITGANAVALPGFATGGSFTVGGEAGIDRNVLAINGIPRARVGHGERVTVTPANDRGPGGTTIHQSIVYSGAVDLADKRFVIQMAEAARQAAIAGVQEANRRRG